jgi:hypothetical protein
VANVPVQLLRAEGAGFNVPTEGVMLTMDDTESPSGTQVNDSPSDPVVSGHCRLPLASTETLIVAMFFIFKVNKLYELGFKEAWIKLIGSTHSNILFS